MSEATTQGERRLDETNKVWFLQRNRLFADVAAGDVSAHAAIFKVVHYPRKASILDGSDTERVVFLVKRGIVRLARLSEDGKEVTLALLGPGDLFGEETLFSGEPRTTVALAVDDVLVCTAKADDLLAIMQTDATMALNVAKTISSRLGATVDIMEDVAYARIPDRILHALERIAAEHGTPVADGIRIDVRLTHTEIASLVASTRETVSLELSRLAAKRRVRYAGQLIVLLTEPAAP
jgi:CRP/FNR family transcriptional regulator